jgi:glycosyltransferase involved in cell wall biosynthesis
LKNIAKEIVVLGMFDVTRRDRAMAVRIYSMYTALQEFAPTTLISGSRSARRKAIVQFLLKGGLRRTRAVYVEASTSAAGETDLFLLGLVRAAKIPLIVFIPDGYQLFPALFPRLGLKVALLDWGWRRSIAAYLRFADVLVFPSWGLAACFPARQPTDTLPPAGPRALEPSSLSASPPTIVYVGTADYRYGADLLLDAMQQVVVHYPDAVCRLITQDTSYLDGYSLHSAHWLTVEKRTFEELGVVMRAATLAVIPLRINEYNDLAMPVKLFDCMAFGLPLVVTACRDMAAFVQDLEAGLVVGDRADELAQGIMRLLADRDLAMRLGQNSYRAIQSAHSWPHRAAQLLQMIEGLEQNTNVARRQQTTIEERR